jgi:acyl carrier protein
VDYYPVIGMERFTDCFIFRPFVVVHISPRSLSFSIAIHCRAFAMTDTDTTQTIRRILKEHGRLSKDAATLAPESDLYEAGLTSHASVNVMLALEGEFEIEFPDHMLKRSVFESIAAISEAVGELQAA